MSKTAQKFLSYTFLTILAVILLTHYRGFAAVTSAFAGGYRSIVGAFITPTKA